MLPIAHPERRLLRSRQHRLPQLRGACRRLLDRIELAHNLAVAEEERHLARVVADALDHLLTRGRELWPHQPENPRRATRRARKR